MRELLIDRKKCTSCEVCLSACPFGALSLQGNGVVVGDQCNLCGACVDECPEGALVMSGERKDVDVSDWQGIWVFVEHADGEMAGVVGELLSEAKRMAQRAGYEVSAVLAGSGVGHLVDQVTARGADRVYLVDHERLAAMHEETYADLLATMVRRYRPSVFLFGATVRGRSLAPRLAARLGTGLTADCTELDMESSGRLTQTRPAFGGNIMATIVCPNHRPQMATVRPRILRADPPDPDREAEVIDLSGEMEVAEARTVLLEAAQEEGEGVKIEDADVIVAGGRGLGSPEGFDALRDLARTLGGAVGASRPVVDSGWIPYPHQVGQTGKTVSPTVYIACGISGAVQHLAGMRSSDIIIAINRNPEAPIFKIATYGLVGDVFKIISHLKDEVEKARDGEGG